jgi:hypothetical protein
MRVKGRGVREGEKARAGYERSAIDVSKMLFQANQPKKLNFRLPLNQTPQIRFIRAADIRMRDLIRRTTLRSIRAVRMSFISFSISSGRGDIP